jgi:MYXO-CTERM domain-containing protein
MMLDLARRMPRSSVGTLALVAALAAPETARAQTVLRADDGTFESMWALTSPDAGPDDWVGVAYAPPLEYPFRVVSATMFGLDTACCQGSTCSDTLCGNFVDWDRWIIGSANLAVDPAGLTPNVTTPIAVQSNVAVPGAGATAMAPPWTLTPTAWTLPVGTVFDAAGRVFFAVKYLDGDQWMRFAVDASSANAGTSIHTADGFRTRASIWAFGNVGMRIAIEPIFNLRLAPEAQAPRFELAGAVDVVMASLRVTGGASGTTISRLRLRGSGSGDERVDLTRVRLVVDSDQDGVVDAGEPQLASGTYLADDGTVELTLSRVLAAGAAERWLVVYDLAASASGGETFRVELASASDVTATSGAPFLSGATAGALRGPTLTVAGRLVAERGPASMTPRVVRAGEVDVPALQLRLRAENEAFAVSALTFSASGTLVDHTQLARIRLFADVDGSGTVTAADALLGTSSFAADDGQRRFTFAPRTIPAQQSADFVLAVDLGAGAPGGASFRAVLALPTDVEALGVASGAPPTSGPRAIAGAPVIGQQATIGGALVVSRGAGTPPDGPAQPGASNVVMLQLALAAGGEAIELSRLELEASGTGVEPLHVARVSLFRDANQNGAVDAGDLLVGGPAIFAADDGRVAFAPSGEQLAAGVTRSYLVAYDFTLAPNGSETFRVRVASSAAVDAQGVASAAPLVATGTFPIVGPERTMLGGLSAQLGTEVSASPRAQPGALDVALAALRVSAQGERFDLDRLVVDLSGSLRDDADLIRLALWSDGGVLGVRDAGDVLLAAARPANDDARVAWTLAPGASVLAGQSSRWLVTADLAGSCQAGATLRLTFPPDALSARGVWSGQVQARGFPLSTGLASIGGTLSIELAPRSPSGVVALPGAVGVVVLATRASAALEPITTDRVRVRASGSMDDLAHIARVALHVDANGDGALDAVDPLLASGRFAVDDGALDLSFAPRTIAAGGREDWLFVIDLAPAVPAGVTLALMLDAPGAISAGAPSGRLPSAIGLPLVGPTASTLGRVAIERTPGAPSARAVARGAREVPLAAWTLRAESETFTIDRLELRARGTLDDANELDALRLYADNDANGVPSPGDVLLAGPVRFLGDDGAVAMQGLGLAVAPGTPRALLVTVDVSSQAPSGRTLRVELPDAAAVGATGLGGRAVTQLGGLPQSSAVVSVGGTVLAARSAPSFVGRVIRRGDRGVLVLGLELSTDLEAATIATLTLRGEGSADEARDLDAIRVVHDLGRDGRADASDPILASGRFTTDGGSLSLPIALPLGAASVAELVVIVDVAASALGGGAVVLSHDPLAGLGLSSASGAVPPRGAAITSVASTIGGGFAVAAAAPTNGRAVDRTVPTLAVLGLELVADNEVCAVDALTVTAVGSADDVAAMTRVTLAVDVDADGVLGAADVVLARGGPFSIDDGALTLGGFTRTLARGARERWVVAYDLSGRARDGQTLGARLARGEDLSVRCDVSGSTRALGAPIDGPSFRVEERGALTVRASAGTPPAGFLPRGRVRAPLLAVTLEAEVHPIDVDALTWTATSTPAGVLGRVELFVDTNDDGQLDRGDVALGAPTSVAADRATIATPGLRARPGLPTSVLLVGDVVPTTPRGATFAVALARAADVSARGPLGAVPVRGAPVRSAAMSIAGDLVVSAAPVRTATVVDDDARDVGLLGLHLDASDDEFALASLVVTAALADPGAVVSTLRLIDDRDASGTASPGDVVLASDAVFAAGGRRAELRLTAPAVIPRGGRATWLVTGNLSGRAASGTIVQVDLAANADLRATGARRGAAEPLGAPVQGPRVVVGPSLRVARGAAAPVDAAVAADARGVPAMQLALTAANEDVTITRLTLRARGTLDDVRAVKQVRLVLDQNGDGRLDPGDVDVGAARRPDADDGIVSFSPLAELVAERTTSAYLVLLDLSGDGRAGETVTFSLESDSSVTALGSTSGGIRVAGAPVAGARLTLAGALTIGRGPASPPGVGVRPAQTFPALQLTLEARGETALVEALALTLDGDPSVVAELALWTDDDGDGAVGGLDRPLGVASRPGALARLTGLGLEVAPGRTERLLVVPKLADPAAEGATIRVQVVDDAAVTARGPAGETIAAVGAPVAGSTFTIITPDPIAVAPVGEGGCGCSAAEPRGAAVEAALGLFVLGLAARRRRLGPRRPRARTVGGL